ncbi:MAG: hypothetical protein ACU836_18565 [Gammaproteobacteria bacterium]
MTVFPLSRTETEKTGKTDSVTNEDFLRTLFGETIDGARPVVVSFTGDPLTAPKRVWFGHPWLNDNERLPGDANNYFSLALFRPEKRVDIGAGRPSSSPSTRLCSMILAARYRWNE